MSEAREYYDSLIAQGYPVHEALPYTQQHFPEFVVTDNDSQIVDSSNIIGTPELSQQPVIFIASPSKSPLPIWTKKLSIIGAMVVVFVIVAAGLYAWASILATEEQSEAINDVWYIGNTSFFTFHYNGSAEVFSGDDYIQGSWSADSNLLTLAGLNFAKEKDGTDKMENGTYNFAVIDKWLFITDDLHPKCIVLSSGLNMSHEEFIFEGIVLSSEKMSDEEFISEVQNLTTLPPFCDGTIFEPGDSTFQYLYSATDHTDVPDAGTDDRLFVLQWSRAPKDLNWANIVIQIIGDDGVPTTCSVDAGDGNCKLVQYGSDPLTWEKAEIVHVIENGKAICAAAPCSLEIKISDVRSGVIILQNYGLTSVLVE